MERTTVIKGDKFSYSGMFQLRDLFSLINSYLRQVGYDKKVDGQTMQEYGNRKVVSVEMKPWKKINDYIRLELEMAMEADFEDVIVNLDGKETTVQKGSFSMAIYAHIGADYEGDWEKKAEYFFLRTLFNKFLNKQKMTEWDILLKEQVEHLKAEMSTFLNMHHFNEYHTERDIIK